MRAKYSVAFVLICLSFILPARGADPADQHPGINLIPWPKSISVAPGYLPITDQTRIVAADAELKPLAQIVSDEFKAVIGKQLPVADGAPRAGDIVLRINKSIKADEPIISVRGQDVVHTTDGAHTVVVGDQAVVEGFDYRAVAEGTSTLLQDISTNGGTFQLAKITVKDWPNADYCGMMIDVARQDHPIEYLKKMVDVCRFYKVRYMHLHMTDDQGWTFPSTKYPQLGTKNESVHGGIAAERYTLEQMKDLAAYADAGGIAIVPELEVPGHSGAALRSFPEVFDALNPQTGAPVGLGCMNMANEEIYPVLDTLIGEMCDVFKSSPYFHIGSDEVSDGRVALYSGYPAFMAKHHLKSDDELSTYFIRSVGEMVKKHGKKAIKWEGLANEASKDIVIMCWVSKSNTARALLDQGYTTITCPWELGVPWDQWSMYVDNGSMLTKKDSVLGATLVAWEQPAEFQLNSTRAVARRQERTWGPDNTPTLAGFEVRYQALDAMVGKLIDREPKTRFAATFDDPAGYAGFQSPAFALDGNDDSFYLAARKLNANESFTVNLEKPTLIYSIDALTGSNKHGLFSGELQVAGDDGVFHTVANFTDGRATTVLPDHHVKAIRLLATSDQTEPLAVREVKLQMMTELSGKVNDPDKTIGEGNIGITTGDTTFGPRFTAELPVIVDGKTLRFDNGGGGGLTYNGAIMGTGNVEIAMGGKKGRHPPLVLSGKSANPFDGTYTVKQGRVELSKEADKGESVDALAGNIIVGGQGDNDCIYWKQNNQIKDTANVTLLDSSEGGASLNLNGCTETFSTLTLGAHCKVLTDGEKRDGVLTLEKAIFDGKPLPTGAYADGCGWVQGSGYVVVGPVKFVDVSANVADPANSIGGDSMAVLKGAADLTLTGSAFNAPINLNGSPLTLTSTAAQPVAYGGFITGSGSVSIHGSGSDNAPLEFSGSSSNTFQGPLSVTHGVLKLNKVSAAVAVPGDLIVGSDVQNQNAAIVWGGDGQVSPGTKITLQGTGAVFIDLAGHHAVANTLTMGPGAKVRTGEGGTLKVHQIIIDGKRLAAGVYSQGQPWLEGSGSITIDPRVDIKGMCGDPQNQIGAGNIANLTGNTEFGYPCGGGDYDIITNGFNVVFDSGNGNAYCYTGTVSGTGNITFQMGPSYTGFKDAPMRLAGSKPNTTTGKFIVAKGRVQLEKNDGVDAISGDVIVGGQGFNDCLYWKKSNQIKDSATITLIDTPNSGAAYLNLNGCTETAAALVMTPNNVVHTDGDDGSGGVLTVKSVKIGGTPLSLGTYTAANAKWVVGAGKVIVAP